MKKYIELRAEDLRWKCDLKSLPFKTTKGLKAYEGILGQEQAIRSIKFGIEMQAPGYNIFATGLSGTGKATTMKKQLEKLEEEDVQLSDLAYVYNFGDANQPMLLKFKAGEAKVFKKELKKFYKHLITHVQKAFKKDSFVAKINKMILEYQGKINDAYSQLTERAKAIGFRIMNTDKDNKEVPPYVMYVFESKLYSEQELESLRIEGKISAGIYKKLKADFADLEDQVSSFSEAMVSLEEAMDEAIYKKEIELVRKNVKIAQNGLLEKFNGNDVKKFLDNLINFIYFFYRELFFNKEKIEIDHLVDVNIILDNSGKTKKPIVSEPFPTFSNLFGTIEKVTDEKGNTTSNYTLIRAGSLIKAQGGILLINLNDIAEDPLVWHTLKKALLHQLLEISESPTSLQLAPIAIKPQPIPLDVKVIVMSSQNIYSRLAMRDLEFKKIFKVKADFDYEVENKPEILEEYSAVIKKIIETENLLEFDQSAICYILELSARFAGKKSKLSMRFSSIADIAREASYWAKIDNAKVVSAKHVSLSYEEAKKRYGMFEQKTTELYLDGTYLIETTGKRVGSINGLVVFDSDFYSFGRPTRITSTVSLGNGTIINVEREVGWSGRHSNKGMLIIAGYFKEIFGQEIPLSFNANIVFEQSYGPIDGDSASCAEIYALLSTLSDLPLKQGIAVTGSLNQKGDVQPIGGVNEKIEGFYEICKIKGLDGTQGVIIPIQNVKDLMLNEEVVKAVKMGKFHIYPIAKVEEGIHILTDFPAGNANEPDNKTVFGRVFNKIELLYARSRNIRQMAHPPSKQLSRKTKKQNL